MKKDVLTPRERLGLLLIDEKPDRAPVIPLITSHAATVAGIRMREYYTDGKAMARAQLIALEEYGHDAISIFSEVGIVAEAMGSVFSYPDDDLPVLKQPALAAVPAGRLGVPDPKKDGRLPVYLTAIEYAYDALADRVPILAYVPAPFTTGMSLIDPNQFLVDTIRNPERVQEILERSLAATVEFCFEIINAGGLPVIVDPLASASVISPKTYRTFALPFEARLIKFLHRYDLDIILHICGDTGPLLELLPETQADLISIDRVDIGQVMDKLSARMRIIGNYDTSQIALADPATIAGEVAMLVERAKTAGKGYIASTGCEVPIRTPKENVKAFIAAARESAWYWE